MSTLYISDIDVIILDMNFELAKQEGIYSTQEVLAAMSEAILGDTYGVDEKGDLWFGPEGREVCISTVAFMKAYDSIFGINHIISTENQHIPGPLSEKMSVDDISTEVPEKILINTLKRGIDTELMIPGLSSHIETLGLYPECLIMGNKLYLLFNVQFAATASFPWEIDPTDEIDSLFWAHTIEDLLAVMEVTCRKLKYKPEKAAMMREIIAEEPIPLLAATI